MKKTHMFYYVFISIAYMFFCSYTLAQESLVAGSTQAISKTLVVLFGVVVLIIGLAWLSKFFGVNNLVGHKNIKAIANIPLGQREKAVLVDVYGKKILLGVAPGSINTLYVFDDVALTSAQVENKSDESKSLQDEISSDERSYEKLLPREYDEESIVSKKKGDNPKSSKKISKETLEFSSFIKKIMSSGNVNR